MNELLRAKLQPFIQTVINEAVGSIDERIQQARTEVEEWESQWGTAPAQPMLDLGVQERIKLLIKGEEIPDPTKLESTVANQQLEKAITKHWAIKTP